LKRLGFVAVGALGDVIRDDRLDGLRIVYAITDPRGRDVVLFGETERGRDVRARLKKHLSERTAAGLIEPRSRVYVHMLVTEAYALGAYREATGHLPALKKQVRRYHLQRTSPRR
jgi:hypothetical protein